MDTLPAIVVAKNDWLHHQIEVDYPTKESLKGRDLYFSRYGNELIYGLDEIEGQPNINAEDIFLVDFHRLTVKFALLQAQKWPSQDDQDLILEFLSQIIYSSPCQLYLAFAEGVAVAASIVTCVDNECLISDVMCIESVHRDDFVQSLAWKLQAQGLTVTDVEL
ncbi:flavodoxin [Vibrio sp. FNV 38]|nr:flavodoxin [Vibrio sp. FNV 38]